MEAALLVSGEASGNSINNTSRKNSSAHFNRRSEAITRGSPYQKAAALVDLAGVSRLTRLKVIYLLILVADFLVYALYLSPVACDFLPLRIAPYIRVVLFIPNIRELRDSLFVLAGMLSTYLNVLALGLLFLLFSSWLAYVIFEDTQQGKTVFTSYGTTLYQMFGYLRTRMLGTLPSDSELPTKQSEHLVLSAEPIFYFEFWVKAIVPS